MSEISSNLNTSVPRKRNNSIIPLEFRNDTSDGGMERAALATVFGVREYTESKIFWNNDDELAQDFTTTTSTLQRNSSKKSYTSSSNNRCSTIMMQTSGVLQPPAPPPIHQHQQQHQQQQQQSRSLPKIPVVSEFGDIWSESHFAAEKEQRQQPIAESTKTHIQDNNINPFQLSPPTDLSDFSQTIFDLIESDENPNLILWGIDAKRQTTIPSTAPSNLDEKDYIPINHNKRKLRWSAQQLISLKLKKKTSADLTNVVPEHQTTQEEARVIEAATIEKLVEKLTISLGKSTRCLTCISLSTNYYALKTILS